MSQTAFSEAAWFYEEKGQRKGPVSEEEIKGLIARAALSHGSTVWRKGFPDWLKIENTELAEYLDESGPPPLSGQNISNTIIWVLAFAPIIGYFLEWTIAYAVNDGNDLAAMIAMANSKYWFVTLILNVALSVYDEKQLEKAGHNTDKFKGWKWIVPVYLYQRAKATKQSLSYFIVWLVSFALVILA